MTTIEIDAEALGVADALLFRRVSATTWAHLGGLGRGRGWAGLVDVDALHEPLLARVPSEVGGVHTETHQPSGRVLGPYYACGAALVRVSHDVLVVLGNPTAPLVGSTDADLLALAGRIDAELEEIAPSKRLADELEVLHAIRTLTTSTAPDLNGTLQHVLDVATSALSCEVGLLRDGAGHTVTTSSWDGIDLHAPDVSSAIDVLAARATEGDGSTCLQEVGDDPALMALGRTNGMHALFAVSMPAPVGGVLVLGHTAAGPRGFTTLCRQLGVQLADAAAVIAHTAALREELRDAAHAQSRAARSDPLTGLGNRLAWDEALADAQERVDAGSAVTIITLDVDGLKHLNDTCGHAAGDLLLQRCASLLREHTAPEHVVVRLGGDEFAILLPVPADGARACLDSLRDRLGGTASCQATVAASVGMASASPGGSVGDAAREADAAMYAAKRSRRAVHGTLLPGQRVAGPEAAMAQAGLVHAEDWLHGAGDFDIP